ncbi:MAG: fibronectin type III-like domain-contianing protein [Sphingomonadales bacterium]|nr:fibronectin type III-like domain-contianing protein [Sphingomonadales bacterium]MDE2169759.1 fibronectin type III-like domain-contianing protein [Sphingomonadales bacterium]
MAKGYFYIGHVDLTRTQVRVYIALPPGASATGSITIDPAASNHPLGGWSEAQKRWLVPSGRYTVLVGTSSAPRDLVDAGQFER